VSNHQPKGITSQRRGHAEKREELGVTRAPCTRSGSAPPLTMKALDETAAIDSKVVASRRQVRKLPGETENDGNCGSRDSRK
jgi:hypothetical protein